MCLTLKGSKRIIFTAVTLMLVFALGFTVTWADADEGFTLQDIPEITNRKPLNVALEAGGAADTIIPFLKRFSEATGIKVTHESMVFADLYSKEIVELMAGTGAYDLVVTETSWTNEWEEYLYSMRELAERYNPGGWEAFKEYLAGHDTGVLRMCSTRDGVLMGVPYYNYTLIQYYRKDVFQNPIERENFKEKYGYELKPATTWEEVMDQAEFFTRKAGETLKGEELDHNIYGVSLMGGRYPHVQDEISARLWGRGGRWARLVEDKDGNAVGFTILDKDMEKLEWAFDNYHKMMKFAPPGSENAYWDQAIANIVEGNTIIVPSVYSSLWQWAATVGENITGAKMGGAPVPLSRPYTGAFHFSPSVDSQNPEASFWLLKYIGAEKTQQEMAEAGWVAARRSSFDQPKYKTDKWYKVTGWVEPTMKEWDAQADEIDTYLHFNSAAFGKLYAEMTIIGHENAIGKTTPAKSVEAWIQTFKKLQNKFGELPFIPVEDVKAQGYEIVGLKK